MFSSYPTYLPNDSNNLNGSGRDLQSSFKYTKALSAPCGQHYLCKFLWCYLFVWSKWANGSIWSTKKSGDIPALFNFSFWFDCCCFIYICSCPFSLICAFRLLYRELIPLIQLLKPDFWRTLYKNSLVCPNWPIECAHFVPEYGFIYADSV